MEGSGVGERGKRKTTLVTTAGKVNSTEEEELYINTLTRFGALTRGSSVVNWWTIVDHFHLKNAILPVLKIVF